MLFETLTQNLMNPAVLCFFLGMSACLMRSDLEFPKPLPKLFSLYLLFAIGFKGGYGIYATGLTREVVLSLAVCVILSALVPFYAFAILRKHFGVYNAAALAATYGSISAVTFITATVFLDDRGTAYGSYMVAAMALMESPAIISGVLLARYFGVRNESDTRISWSEILRDAFLNGSVVVLVGAMFIGWVTGDRGYTLLKPFTHDLFYGMLCLFLLDMGIVAARRFHDLGGKGLPMLGYGIGLPILNAMLAIPLVWLMDMSLGSGLLMVILAGSASYIAVPAAMRLAVPQSNASIYITMSLAISFPFNILLGIPAYYSILQFIGLS